MCEWDGEETVTLKPLTESLTEDTEGYEGNPRPRIRAARLHGAIESGKRIAESENRLIYSLTRKVHNISVQHSCSNMSV